MGIGLHDEIPHFGMEHVLQCQRDLIEGFGPVGACGSHVPPAVAERVGLAGAERDFGAGGFDTVLTSIPPPMAGLAGNRSSAIIANQHRSGDPAHT